MLEAKKKKLRWDRFVSEEMSLIRVVNGKIINQRPRQNQIKSSGGKLNWVNIDFPSGDAQLHIIFDELVHPPSRTDPTYLHSESTTGTK